MNKILDLNKLISEREYLSNCVNSDNDVIIIEKGLTDGSREERDLI